MKKVLTVLLAASMLSAALVGCSSSSSSDSSSSDSSSSSSDSSSDDSSGEVIELSMWHYFGDDQYVYFQEYVEMYNEMQDEIYINEEYVSRDDLLTQYAIGAVSGELPDIAMVDGPDHAAYAAMGIFVDITDYFEAWDDNEYLDGPISSCMYDGKVYGLPFASNCLGLFYNEDMFAEAGVTEAPETWEELEEIAALLTTDTTYGFALCADAQEEGTFQFISFLESAGSYSDLDSDGSIAAMQLYENLIDAGSMSMEVISWTQTDVYQQFLAGSAAMMINGSWQVELLRTNADFNWNVTYVPASEDGDHASTLGGENFTICTTTETDAAWEFLTWFCGSEISAEFNQKCTKFSPHSNVDNAALYEGDEIMSMFAEVMETTVARGPSEYWPDISYAIYTSISEVVTGQKSAAEAMVDAQAYIDEVLAEAE